MGERGPIETMCFGAHDTTLHIEALKVLVYDMGDVLKPRQLERIKQRLFKAKSLLEEVEQLLLEDT